MMNVGGMGGMGGGQYGGGGGGGQYGGPNAMAGQHNRENPLHISWNNNAMFPPNQLNPDNILDYFCNPANPFYEKQCDNEQIRMQGHQVTLERLRGMNGVQYVVLKCMEPLFVIRKQVRNAHNSEEAHPLADYYIINGMVHQAPDLASVINCRVLTAMHHLRSSFELACKYSRYHPSKGYWWEFDDGASTSSGNNNGNNNNNQQSGDGNNQQSRSSSKDGSGENDAGGKSTKSSSNRSSGDQKKDERSTLYQRTRTDALLNLLSSKFPIEDETGKEGKPVGLEDGGPGGLPDDGNRSEAGSSTSGIKREHPSNVNQDASSVNPNNTSQPPFKRTKNEN